MYIQFPKEQKEKIKDRIRQYFLDERGEEIGDLAAENLLDFITKEIGPVYYNQALNDAQKAVDERMANMEEDLLSMKRPIE
ncbi:MAG TPA: DUF2164 domain-containing protein [Bacillales bacterium]|nr:DUF2164 domain-containing protein [Bacillales bacterium]